MFDNVQGVTVHEHVAMAYEIWELIQGRRIVDEADVAHTQDRLKVIGNSSFQILENKSRPKIFKTE